MLGMLDGPVTKPVKFAGMLMCVVSRVCGSAKSGAGEAE